MRAISLYLFALGAYAQSDSGVLLRHTFESGTSGWTVMGQGGEVRAAGGALEYSYEVKAKQFSIAVLPAPPEAARLRRVRFRLKTDHDTAVAMMLSEKKPGGGNYVAMFWAPGGAWQTVELTPADFAASDGPNDPVDSDGKLDLDQVDGIAILDMAQFFANQPENPQMPMIVNRAMGGHKLQLANFELLAGAGGGARGPLEIDHFDRGYVEWITMGGIQMKLAPQDNPLHEPALLATYEQKQGAYGILVRRLANLDLSQAGGIAFDIASKADATLIVALELKNGKRFNQTIYPPADGEVFHVKLGFGDFEGEGKLEGAQLKSLVLTDVTAAEGGGKPNMLWIGRVDGVSGK